MINTEIKSVKEIIKSDENLQVLLLDDGSKAYNYLKLTGKVEIDEEVYVNTTAVDLSLGTGGYHFVINKLNPSSRKNNDPGHIMKLRYTPLQIKTYTIEEQVGEKLDDVLLKGHSVITMELHSMLVPLVLAFKKLNPNIKISYCMTDGGALPAFHSEAVKALREKGLLEGVITCGHSFGGDLESVNHITAVQGSVTILKSDVTIIGMGPGIVGTGTKYGFTGIEQSFISDTLDKLGCNVYPALRVGFADNRERHRGISHHSLTIMGTLMRGNYTLVLSHMDRRHLKRILNQLNDENLLHRHRIVISKDVDIEEMANELRLKLSSMGRGIKENPHYFSCLTALARYVYKSL